MLHVRKYVLVIAIYLMTQSITWTKNKFEVTVTSAERYLPNHTSCNCKNYFTDPISGVTLVNLIYNYTPY